MMKPSTIDQLKLLSLNRSRLSSGCAAVSCRQMKMAKSTAEAISRPTTSPLPQPSELLRSMAYISATTAGVAVARPM